MFGCVLFFCFLPMIFINHKNWGLLSAIFVRTFELLLFNKKKIKMTELITLKQEAHRTILLMVGTIPLLEESWMTSKEQNINEE